MPPSTHKGVTGYIFRFIGCQPYGGAGNIEGLPDAVHRDEAQ